MRSLLVIFSKILLYSVMVVICFEISLLLLGYRSLRNQVYKIEASPANAFVGDENLGIRLNMGVYKITLNDRIQFETTHTKSKTRLVPCKNQSDSLKIAFLGCSFTYGYGVNDDENFVSRIQDSLSNGRVVNYATPGYGTVQSYLQLKEILAKNETKIVVLCFSDFHFDRNILSQEFRSNLKIGFRNSSNDVDNRMKEARFPFISSSCLKVQYDKWEDLYHNYYLRDYLASSNWLQKTVDKFMDRNANALKVTKALLLKMNSLCVKNNVKFVVFCLDSSKETSQLRNEVHLKYWKNIHFDFKSKDLTNLPFDSHPNAFGHKWMAKKMIPFLKKVMLESK
jgi:hypothetical protein